MYYKIEGHKDGWNYTLIAGDDDVIYTRQDIKDIIEENGINGMSALVVHKYRSIDDVYQAHS